jgi:hypothetical protein
VQEKRRKTQRIGKVLYESLLRIFAFSLRPLRLCGKNLCCLCLSRTGFAGEISGSDKNDITQAEVGFAVRIIPAALVRDGTKHRVASFRMTLGNLSGQAFDVNINGSLRRVACPVNLENGPRKTGVMIEVQSGFEVLRRDGAGRNPNRFAFLEAQ